MGTARGGRGLAWAGVAVLIGALLVPILGTVAAGAATPVVAIGDASVQEGNTGSRNAVLPVTLSQPRTAGVVTVDYVIAGVDATAGTAKNPNADFNAKGGKTKTLTFKAGQVVKYVNVPVYPDTVGESDETFSVTISNPSGATLGDQTGIGTIVDDDAGAGNRVSVGDASIHEGDVTKRGVKFTVSLTQPATAQVSVDYRIVPVTATGGYKSGSVPVGTDIRDNLQQVKTLVFKPKAASGLTKVHAAVTVLVYPDTVGESDETFHVDLSNVQGPAALGTATGTGTIVDDDVPVSALATVALAGPGGGSVVSSPPGITCGPTCSASFPGGSTVTLSATPDGLSTFAGWSGACSGTGICTLTMNGDRAVTATFVLMPPDTVWDQVGGGNEHSCALTSGTVQCWGVGLEGELGTGANTPTVDSPVAVSGLTGVAQLAVGDHHACALTTGGGVWCWGLNSNGQLGDGSTTNRNAPVAVAGLGSGVAAISAGVGHSCAVTILGGAYCWGRNGAGELGDGSTTQSSTPVPVFGLGTGVGSVSAGNRHSCAVTTGGAALCWGANGSGQLGDGSTTASTVPVGVTGLGSGVAQIAAGGLDHTCAATTAGAAYCWGDNTVGELGDGSTTDSSVPVGVSGLGTGVAEVSAGGFVEEDAFLYSCARTTGGAVSCWGSNARNQLGNDLGDESDLPVVVTGFDAAVTQLASGSDHSCVVTSLGSAWCWGNPATGKLGDGGVGGPVPPVRVANAS